ncbi:hypothetical protein CMV_000005 [Castanea mollissima]|nr:hypothetical protein CMV_000005 [Castanea mollissima]
MRVGGLKEDQVGGLCRDKQAAQAQADEVGWRRGREWDTAKALGSVKGPGQLARPSELARPREGGDHDGEACPSGRRVASWVTEKCDCTHDNVARQNGTE